MKETKFTHNNYYHNNNTMPKFQKTLGGGLASFIVLKLITILLDKYYSANKTCSQIGFSSSFYSLPGYLSINNL